EEETALHEQVVLPLDVAPRTNAPARDPFGDGTENEYDAGTEHRAPDAHEGQHDSDERCQRDGDDGDLYASHREQARRRAAPVHVTLFLLGHCAAEYCGV